MITKIRTEDVRCMWPAVSEYIRKSAETAQNGLHAGHVYQWLITGEGTLWVIGDNRAVAVTLVENPYGIPVLSIPIVGGEGFFDWIEELDQVMNDYACENNCKVIEFYGRHAYLKVGKRFGWKNTHTVMTREVQYE